MTEQPTQTSEQPLESWKAIAAYLNRDVRTVIRWEQSEGLPVHRHRHLARSSVYAYASELDAWRQSRKTGTSAAEPVPSTRRLRSVAAAAAFCLATLTAGSGRIDGAAPITQSGPTARQLRADVDTTGSVSRDGRLVSDAGATAGSVVIRDLGTGKEREFSAKTSASEGDGVVYRSILSPDGARVLVLWQTAAIAPGSSLRVIDVNAGGPPKILYEGGEWIEPDAWSPDGRTIAVQFRRNKAWQIALLSGDGTMRTLKTTTWSRSTALFFSPDGRWLAYDLPVTQGSLNRDIYVVAVDGASEVTAVEHRSADRVMGWVADGSALLFASDRSGREALYALPIRDGKPAGEPVSAKSDLGRARRSFGVTSAGTLMVALQTSAGTVKTVDVDFKTGKLLGPVTSPIETYQWESDQPAWSPDGERLVFRLEKPESRRVLAVVDRATGSIEEHSVSLQELNRLTWIADGAVAFIARDLNRGQPVVYRFDVTTNVPEPMFDLREAGAVGQFFVSPNDRTLYYRKRENGALTVYVRDLRTKQDRLVPVASPFAPSPDGQSIAFIEVTPAAGTAALKVRSENDGTVKVIQEFAKDHGLLALVRWTPDGKRLVYGRWIDKRETPTAFAVPLDGGPAVELDAQVPGHPSLAISPNGRTVAFDSGGSTVELWALDNLFPVVRR